MKKALLLVLDGWGINKEKENNAIAQANPVFWNSLLTKYPNIVLHAREESVGLSKGYLSGSQVGHLAIAAGRVVWQSGPKIEKTISDGTFSDNEILVQVKNHLDSFGSTAHIVGMLSSGGVHSHINHLKALIAWAKEKKVESVALHLFLDGRDMAPKSALGLLAELRPHLTENIRIASITGRLFGMDRNENWDRTVEAYHVLTSVANEQAVSPEQYIEKSYQDGLTDEFISPANFTDQVVKDGDAIIFFNFRSDRMRQIVKLFNQLAPGAVQSEVAVPNNLLMASMTEYSDEFTGVHVLFSQEIPKNTLGEWIGKQGLKQLRVTETEKFAHLTFFFNGGREVVFEGETRMMIPSLRVRNFASHPEMSLVEITNTLQRALEDDVYDLLICNFANGDMVGHSGEMPAAIQAVKAVDTALAKVIPIAKAKGYTTIITADHGNIEYMEEAGQPHTAHTHNDVPFIVVDENIKLNDRGYLHQVAPTVLEIMGLEKPAEMTSDSLIKK